MGKDAMITELSFLASVNNDFKKAWIFFAQTNLIHQG